MPPFKQAQAMASGSGEGWAGAQQAGPLNDCATAVWLLQAGPGQPPSRVLQHGADGAGPPRVAERGRGGRGTCTWAPHCTTWSLPDLAAPLTPGMAWRNVAQMAEFHSAARQDSVVHCSSSMCTLPDSAHLPYCLPVQDCTRLVLQVWDAAGRQHLLQLQLPPGFPQTSPALVVAPDLPLPLQVR